MFLYLGWNRKLNKKHVTLFFSFGLSYSFMDEISMVLKSNDFLFMTFFLELQAPYKSRETELLLAAFFSEEDSRPPKSKLLLPLAV